MDIRVFDELGNIARSKVVPLNHAEAPFLSTAVKVAELNALINLRHRPYSKMEYIRLIDEKKAEIEAINRQNEQIAKDNDAARVDVEAANKVAFKAQMDNFDNAIAAVRRVRDKLLMASDWTHCTDSPLSGTKKTEYALYRKALRDITIGITTRAQVDSLVFPAEPK